MISYRIYSLIEILRADNIREDLLKEVKDYYNPYGIKNGIFLCDEKAIIKLIGVDGGEPEDQTLYRDWNWVVEALNNAYKEGFFDGLAVKENKND